MTVTIATPPKSPNETLRMHWSRRQAHNQRIYLEVAAQHAALGRPRFDGPVILDIERHGPRPLDDDNLIGSLKPVIDGLIGCGAIADDDWRRVRIGERRQLKAAARESKLLVTVRECLDFSQRLGVGSQR